MIFTDDQMQRINAVNRMKCKVNIQVQDFKEDGVENFINDIKGRFYGKLPEDIKEFSCERYVQAQEIDALLTIRNRFSIYAGIIDTMIADYCIRVCTGDTMVDDYTRTAEISILSEICKNWNLVPEHLHGDAEMLMSGLVCETLAQSSSRPR